MPPLIMTPNAQPELTSADLSVLGPLAEHRLLIVPQLAVLLGVGAATATRRCRRLADARLLRLERTFNRLPAAASIAAAGLQTIGSPLKPPAFNLAEYRHDVGVGWLWLAARAGRFGRPRTLLTERVMQARDDRQAGAHGAGGSGIGLGVFGADGRVRRHYPDLLIELPGGGNVAVELELTAKSSARMTAIMSAYASDARVARIVYLAGSETVARTVDRAAAAAGTADRVHIRLLAADGIEGASVAGTRDDGRALRSARSRAVMCR